MKKDEEKIEKEQTQLKAEAEEVRKKIDAAYHEMVIAEPMEQRKTAAAKKAKLEQEHARITASGAALNHLLTMQKAAAKAETELNEKRWKADVDLNPLLENLKRRREAITRTAASDPHVDVAKLARDLNALGVQEQVLVNIGDTQDRILKELGAIREAEREILECRKLQATFDAQENKVTAELSKMASLAKTAPSEFAELVKRKAELKTIETSIANESRINWLTLENRRIIVQARPQVEEAMRKMPIAVAALKSLPPHPECKSRKTELVNIFFDSNLEESGWRNPVAWGLELHCPGCNSRFRYLLENPKPKPKRKQPTHSQPEIFGPPDASEAL